MSILPAEFIRWAEQTGIVLPQDLVDAVRATAGRIEDRRSLTAERDELREEVKRLNDEAARNKPLRLVSERHTSRSSSEWRWGNTAITLRRVDLIRPGR